MPPTQRGQAYKLAPGKWGLRFYDQSGAPLRHASVSTVLPSGGVRSDTTSPTGVWKLTSLPAGTYTITITNAGSPTRTISLTAVAGYTVLGDVTL